MWRCGGACCWNFASQTAVVRSANRREPRHYPDPDLRNNAIENLRWVPDSTNLIDHPALVEAGKKRIPHRVFTDDEALEAIRLAGAGETITSIAARFGVAKPTIEGMLYHKT